MHPVLASWLPQYSRTGSIVSEDISVCISSISVNKYRSQRLKEDCHRRNSAVVRGDHRSLVQLPWGTNSSSLECVTAKDDFFHHSEYQPLTRASKQAEF